MDTNDSRAVVLPSKGKSDPVSQQGGASCVEKGGLVCDDKDIKDSVDKKNDRGLVLPIEERYSEKWWKHFNDKECDFRESGNTIFADIIHFQLDYAERNGFRIGGDSEGRKLCQMTIQQQSE